MFEFFKNYEDQNFIPNCLSSGICTVDPTLSALEELLLDEIKQISFYVVRSKEFGYENSKIMNDAVKALSIVLLNTSFYEKEYNNVLDNLIKHKKEAKRNYMHLCKNNPMSCEIVNVPEDINIGSNSSIGKMIKEGEKSLNASYKFIDGEKIGLLKLIVLECKMSARNIERIKSFEPDFDEYDFEVLRLFSLRNTPTVRVEKLKRRILEFAKIAFKIQQKLVSVFKKHYGDRRSTKVLTSAKAGRSILVSGTNIKQLENLLVAIGDREINVYTHNSLIGVHSYPKFQKFKNLVGHWGNDDTLTDFTNFKGVVYLTKDSNQKVDNLYRCLIYSSEEINAKGVVKVEEENYEPLIEAALCHEGFSEDEPEEIFNLEYNDDKINEILETQREIVVFLGGSKNIDFSNLIGNKVVINLQYPTEIDLLHHVVKKAHEKSIETIIFFTRCEPSIISMLLILVECGMKEIYLSRCPLAIVSPHVIESLEKDFAVKVIQ